MKNISLAAAFAIVLLANAFALIHAARNRSGTPDSELSLTQRELQYIGHHGDDENSGVTLYLRWVTQSENLIPFTTAAPKWLDRSKLRTLGFDCRVNPDAGDAVRFYQRQRPRRAFVAFENDGAAWQNFVDAYQDEVARRQQRGLPRDDTLRNSTHLVAIDADLDARSLRNRHADRSRVMIVLAVIAIALNTYPGPVSGSASANPPRLEGRIEQLPSEIHLSRPLSDLFQGGGGRHNEITTSSYTVRLRYGKLLEPWVEDIKFGP